VSGSRILGLFEFPPNNCCGALQGEVSTFVTTRAYNSKRDINAFNNERSDNIIVLRQLNLIIS